jgi:uncharacterized OB-fold protein
LTDVRCRRCSSSDLKPTFLSSQGILWSFTVVHSRPPGNCLLPEPIVPLSLGLVELPEGLVVLAPLRVNGERLQIGLPLRLAPIEAGQDDAGIAMFGFCFEIDEQVMLDA